MSSTHWRLFVLEPKTKTAKFHGGPMDGLELEGDYSMAHDYQSPADSGLFHLYLESKHPGNFYHIGTHRKTLTE